MPTNWVRGFRRIGWVVTAPIAAFIVLLFYEQTKDVSGYQSEQCNREVQPWERTVELSNIRSKAYLPMDTNEEVIRKISASIEKECLSKQDCVKFVESLKKHEGQMDPYAITVEKKVNKFKLAGLIIGALACVALAIQGSISVLAWIARGFKA